MEANEVWSKGPKFRNPAENARATYCCPSSSLRTICQGLQPPQEVPLLLSGCAKLMCLRRESIKHHRRNGVLLSNSRPNSESNIDSRAAVVYRLSRWFPFAFFSFLVILALTAGITGLDPDERWGLIRKSLLLVGAIGLSGSVGLLVIRSLDRRLMVDTGSRLKRHRAGTSRSDDPRAVSDETSNPISPSFSAVSRRWFAVVALGLATMLVGITYVGLQTVWTWTRWPSTTAYYSMLGQSFLEGKTDLPIEPSPALLKSSNPYQTWTSVGGIANLSYHKGRYYM